ncbi:Phospholipase C [Cadophora gregata]|uniref:Phospholipase C n=1 Tax=Cadophora gregata TaxID=51156 RepID=UPI0026DC1D81|nr:Phospholipase C [Cadophora gregata]KAK0099441.1 Phospholipase C [Cadophora gregata f. sp. sojae]KAK0104355.1 Phospholipase C [Cadophora gregata]
MDNARVNSAIRGIAERLFNQLRIDYDPEEHRLHCHGYILNLVGDAFLFKTYGDALAEYNNDYNSSDALTELEFVLWRKKGAIGKAYNYAVKFSRSTLKNDY